MTAPAISTEIVSGATQPEAEQEEPKVGSCWGRIFCCCRCEKKKKSTTTTTTTTTTTITPPSVSSVAISIASVTAPASPSSSYTQPAYSPPLGGGLLLEGTRVLLSAMTLEERRIFARKQPDSPRKPSAS